MSIASTATITQGEPGMLNVSESHSVTLEYRRAGGQLMSRERVQFGGDGQGGFRDNSYCVSAGTASDLL